MKQIFTYTVSLLFAALCATASQAQVRNALTPTPIGAAEYEFDAGKVQANVRIEYPKGGTEAFRAAYEQTVLGAAQRLCSISSDDEQAPAETPAPLTLQGTDNVARPLCEAFVQDAKDFLQDWVDTNNADLEPGDTPISVDDLPGCSVDLTVERVTDNPRYQTYHLFADVYLGGAHGMQYDYYYTLECTTGKLYGLAELFPEAVQGKLKGIVYRNLVEQLKADHSLPDDLPQLADFTLPQAPGVGLLREGVQFQYQPYEIVCYASGMPGCIVPYSQVYAILSEDGKPLVNYVPKRRGVPTPIKGGKR